MYIYIYAQIFLRRVYKSEILQKMYRLNLVQIEGFPMVLINDAHGKH